MTWKKRLSPKMSLGRFFWGHRSGNLGPFFHRFLWSRPLLASICAGLITPAHILCKFTLLTWSLKPKDLLYQLHCVSSSWTVTSVGQVHHKTQISYFLQSFIFKRHIRFGILPFITIIKENCRSISLIVLIIQIMADCDLFTYFSIKGILHEGVP